LCVRCKVITFMSESDPISYSRISAPMKALHSSKWIRLRRIISISIEDMK
jgi:hypothetical protein